MGIYQFYSGFTMHDKQIRKYTNSRHHREPKHKYKQYPKSKRKSPQPKMWVVLMIADNL